MDRLRAAILLAQAKVEREMLRRIAFATIERRILRKRLRRTKESEDLMAGEIRAKMAELRAARNRLVSDLTTEIDDVITDIQAVHADGLEAAKLPRAELDGIKQEVREIHAEFATSTNGGPAGPLPGTPPRSPPPSPGSDVAADTSDKANEVVSGAALASEPSASWAGKK